MRRKTGIPLLLCAAALLAARSAFGDAERTLRAEIPDPAHSAFAIENLVGAMHVTAGAGDSVSVVATVHAESEALAGAVRLERVAGDAGAVTLHVRYPEDERTLRYPGRREDGDWSFDFFSFSSGDGHRYQGRTLRVSRSRGRLLYVDLEVRLPARIAAGRFLDLVGRIEASGLEGKLAFDVASADLRLERLRGQIALHGTSGDVTASDIAGVWSSEFNSGDCSIRGFRGESLSFRTTSGDIAARTSRSPESASRPHRGTPRSETPTSRISRRSPPPETSRSTKGARASRACASTRRAATSSCVFRATRPSRPTRTCRAATSESTTATFTPRWTSGIAAFTATEPAGPTSA